MVLRVFNVAEKPSAAKEIVTVLRQNRPSRSRPGLSRFNQIHEFEMNLSGNQALMVFTSVLGHLKSSDFETRYRKWGSCDPLQLLNPAVSKVEWFVAEDKLPLAQTLKNESRNADWLILWLDCDSEGEKIAVDVADVCKTGRTNIVVKRARFSAMTPGDLFRAVNHLEAPNQLVASMVATRQEIDLRAGSAYTRFLTTELQKFALNAEDDRPIISYGPCQFPTLGLVVDRWLTIQNFVRRPFWVFDLRIKDCKVPFEWARKHLFDEYSAMVLYELCIEESEQDGHLATVTRVDKRVRNKWRPLPLSTVELQKISSRSLRISSHRAMEVTESLYNKGLISYPRTETDQFSSTYNLRDLVAKQAGHHSWGPFASRLLSPPDAQDPVRFQWPRAGGHDDGAHPPIHPTDSAPESFETPDHQKLYEYITKRFLACCSIDARGAETRVEVRAGDSELFSARGLIVEERGYLEVLHPFEQWTDKDMPVALLTVNARLPIESLTFRRSQTQPPPLLQEADLIALMDHHGIGTDATIAEHIKKVQDRHYVEKLQNDGGRFSPTEIGKALVIAHELCQLHLARPHMRARQEVELKRILNGQARASDVLQSALTEYTAKFQALRERRETVDAVFRERFGAVSAQTWGLLQASFSTCGGCSGRMQLKGTGGNNASSRGRGRGRGRATTTEGDRAVHCTTCSVTLRLPRNGDLTGTGQSCPLCSYEVLTVRNIETSSTHTLCPKCYNSPPEGDANRQNRTDNFRCFQCTATCQFASRDSAVCDIATCPVCGSACSIKESRDGACFYATCERGRECQFVYWFPRNSVRTIEKSGARCNRCNSEKLKIVWKRNAVPVGVPDTFEGCIWCDERYVVALVSIGAADAAPGHVRPGQSVPTGGGWGRGGGRFGDIEDSGRGGARRGVARGAGRVRGRSRARGRYMRGNPR